MRASLADGIRDDQRELVRQRHVDFTRDGDAGRELPTDVQIGMVGVNVPIPVPMAFHSFRGMEGSMFGDMAMHGLEGVRFYTRAKKTVTARWPSGHRVGADFKIPTMK